MDCKPDGVVSDIKELRDIKPGGRDSSGSKASVSLLKFSSILIDIYLFLRCTVEPVVCI